MKIGIITRPNEEKWGGDLKALLSIKEGLIQLGHEVIMGRSALEVIRAEFVFLTNTIWDQRSNYQVIDLFKMRYGIIGFHEDHIRYYAAAYGFYEYIQNCLGFGPSSDNGMDYDIARLFEFPELVYYYSIPIPKGTYYNYEILRNALVCIASSPTEAATMKRDCPACNAQVVQWTAGFAEGDDYRYSEAFLHFSGLEKGRYILQVGRLETRKNQLATVLSTKDIDLPLVFIATSGYQPNYERALIAAIQKWRKAPTLIIHQNHANFQDRFLRILNMPRGEKLPREMLLSAYQNAALNLHPAFSELPGYTCLESAKLGIPTLASEWCSVKDYFYDSQKGHSELDGRIRYCSPYHLKQMKAPIEQLLGKQFKGPYSHSVFQRKPVDVAREILHFIGDS